MIALTLILAFAAAEGSPVDRARALLERGAYAEAEAAIAELPSPTRERLEGLLAMQTGAPDRAAAAFARALALAAEGETARGRAVVDPALQLHLAHALLLADRPAEALEALGELGEASSHVAGPLLAARAYRALEAEDRAYAILARAATATFEGELRPLLELVSLCRDAGLRAEARRWAARLLAQSDRSEAPLSRDEGLALFDLLERDPEALPLLELTAAAFPADPEIRARLALSYARQERWLASARLFEEATRLGGDFAFEAADQYRMAGRHREALRLSLRVEPAVRRRAQRLVILFEAGSYARVVALPDPPGDRASLYRRAYAHHALGHRSEAARLARRLLDGPNDSHASSARALLDALGLPPGSP